VFRKGAKEGGASGPPDPRLLALVRYLARRAAERDHERLIAASRGEPRPPER
jgi:hypothetical protein